MIENIPLRERPLKMGAGTLRVERPAIISSINFRGSLNKIGAFSYGNVNVICYNSDIGRYCSIAHDVIIAPFEHPVDWFSTHPFVFGDTGTMAHSQDYMDIMVPEPYAPNALRTTIGNDVWIGARAFIKRGVKIGDGAIIAANSSVVRDVPSFSIVAGSPARVIKTRFDEGVIERIKRLNWWNYKLDRRVLKGISYSDVNKSIDLIERHVKCGDIMKIDFDELTFVNGKIMNESPLDRLEDAV
ncbi:CatB-related O-acetyltransferase [Stappia indica]|uniref:CatB-related O-acetyltransferase n=1 Tax=Stappia indica TaxID=538381 RepID=UPI001CD66388|nr:CatB-related O-acetyltransferase [Stappia indica]MCA1298930.1 CatB-related O-acetyltransferase [Stappia indica]